MPMALPPPLRVTSLATAASAGSVREFRADTARQVDAALDGLLPAPSRADAGVAAAMRYTTLAPGKRIRPVLMLAVTDLYGTGRREALPAACAIEMVHACSLILDDLPCMDDAPTRRGLRSNHRVFGEATAILAAFALLNQAYGILAGVAPGAGETVTAEVGRRLSLALGTEGVIGGQALDLATGAPETDLDRLEAIHSRKTGSLFIASMEVGAILGQASAAERLALVSCAKNLGLAYQIVDDLLDATGSEADLGKPVQADTRGNFVTLAGPTAARRLATELADCAIDQLSILGPRASLLAGLAAEMTTRRS